MIRGMHVPDAAGKSEFPDGSVRWHCDGSLTIKEACTEHCAINHDSKARGTGACGAVTWRRSPSLIMEVS